MINTLQLMVYVLNMVSCMSIINRALSWHLIADYIIKTSLINKGHSGDENYEPLSDELTFSTVRFICAEESKLAIL